MTAIAYSIHSLTKVYKNGVVANNRINLDICQGETFGLLGPNGAGKTTLIKQMVGLLRPTTGSLRLFERDIVRETDMIPQYVAYLSQTLMSLRAYQVREAVLYTGILRGLTVKEANIQTDELLERLHLANLSKRLVVNLSGGQKQLVGIASALIAYRPVVVLDEPTNNLDPVARRLIWDTLSQLREQRGVTVIFVTHNVLEAEQVLTRVAIIDNGRIIALGTPNELKAQVTSQVRLEFHLKNRSVRPCLNGLEAKPMPDEYWRVMVRSDEVYSGIESLVYKIGLKNMDDLRVLLPSLEDVYLALNGSQPRIE